LAANFQSGCGVKNLNEVSMLAIFFLLLILWALGMISSYTFGGAIHLLLVFALIVLVIRLAQGRPVT
jgi:hypothetical protein